MTQFKVGKILEEYSFSNVINHHKNDFKEQTYLMINNTTVYESIPHEKINQGIIGINQPIRNKLSLAIDDKVIVQIYKPKEKSINKININLTSVAKKKGFVSLHEENIKDKIFEIFKKHYFYNSQTLIMKLDTITIVLDINCQDEGYLYQQTQLKIQSNDESLNIISAILLKRDLFKDTYNFEEIGIGGMNIELINIFRRALSTRAIKSSIAQKLGIKHVKGILLHGPPGTGKTLIARKIGGMISKVEPKVVNGPEVMNKYVGQSEENIRKLFDDAIIDEKMNGENSNLHVIIFDEIDAICKTRGGEGVGANVNSNIVNQLLSMIDGIHSLNNIFIIAMTNRKDLLDSALLRAGRIEVHIEIGLPDFEGRIQIFRIHTDKMKSSNMIDKDINFNQLAKLTENYSGAEIEAVVKNASARAIHKQLSSNKEEINESDIIVTNDDFTEAIIEVEPSFGNITKSIMKLLPEKYLNLTALHNKCYDEIAKLIQKPNRLKTALIIGENGTGKTTLAMKLALDKWIKYTKVIKAIDTISMSELSKSFYISDIVTSSYISEDSLIVLDDIEILVNYAKLGNVVTFSNKLYQTLVTLLKTEPSNKLHKLTIIATCTDKEFGELISKFFDNVFELGTLSPLDCKTIGYDNVESLTIRQVLNKY